MTCGCSRGKVVVRGSSSLWVARFRGLDEEVLRGVACVWWNVVGRLPNQPNEDQVTAELVESLFVWARRQGIYIEYQFVPFERTGDGSIVGSRFVDMAVIAEGYGRNIYLAYECKRLNVRGADGARRSQAGDYVGKNGMMRFIEGKYARYLPVGCMLGYVMDGDLPWAYTRIVDAMKARQGGLGLQGEPTAATPIGILRYFVTQHMRGDRWMEIRHALLPFVGGSERSAQEATANV